ncbi:MAG: ABC transporter ATP-binding protein [Clostridiales bacterium]|nr:ABC transporter ATP-binding protein [Clostridiales bacterium]
MLKTLIAQIRQYKWATIFTPVCAAAEVFMEVLIPYTTASLIDKGIMQQSPENVFKYGALMLLLACLSMLFGLLAAQLASRASSGFAANLRDAMYSNIQTFSFANIDKYSTAGLITRMTTDVSNVQMAFQMLTRIAVRAPMTMISSMVMCLAISRQLSLVFLVAVVVLSVALSLIIRQATKTFNQVFKKYDDLNASVQENVNAIRVVKAFVREDHEKEKFSRAATAVYRLFVKAEKIIALNHPVMMLVVYACIISVSWLGAHFVVGGSLTTGELTSVFSYIMSILMSLMMLSMIFVMLTMSAASGRRIAEVLNEKPTLVNPDEPEMVVKDGSIRFEDVSFTYHAEGHGEAILRDINLTIHSGETIGIIGGTGCGKSTLVNLISRLYDVTSGRVLVGGVDVKQYDMEALRNQVSVVLQKNVLFSGSILENLRWGNENATLEECQEACRQACADEFIEKMPEKYDTHIEQGGSNVSGGQKQRLCIARALLKKPRVLILDDSTSAVDTATDARIRQAFSTRIPGTTKIIIAQRVASVMDADRIIVMEDGMISAFDSHENLLNTSDLYREIYETQTSGGGDFDSPDHLAEGGDQQ